MINLTIKACFILKTCIFCTFKKKKKEYKYILSILFKTQASVLSLICSFVHTEAKDLNS